MLNISASNNSTTRGANVDFPKNSPANQGGPQTIVPQGDLVPRSVNADDAIRKKLVQLVTDDSGFGKPLDEWVKGRSLAENRG